MTRPTSMCRSSSCRNAAAETRRQGGRQPDPDQGQAGRDLDKLADRLQLGLDRLHPMFFKVWTWEQKQGPLLGAVAIEQSILNILLFMIIAVAGFGILAIFSMIVVEKTRDIGVMKALGASTSGIRGIFLGYGLLAGCGGQRGRHDRRPALRPLHQRDREGPECGSGSQGL